MSKLRDKFRKKSGDLQRTTQEATTIASNYPRYYSIDKLPKGRSVWNMKNGEHIFDIIPFFTGKKHPTYKPDTPLPVLFLYVHFNVGPNDEQVVCKAKNKIGDQRCPICEYIKQNNLYTADNDLYKRIAAKKRNLYLVWLHDTEKEEDKGIQLLDIADFYMNEKLSVISKVSRGKGLINYTDLDNGKTLIVERSGQGVTTKVTGHRFEDRPEPIPDEIVDQIFSIDEIVNWESDYNATKKLFEIGLGLNVEDSEEEWATCPAGGEFGVDYDTLESCENCRCEQDCAEAYAALGSLDSDEAPFDALPPEEDIVEEEDEDDPEDMIEEEEQEEEDEYEEEVEETPPPAPKPRTRRRRTAPVSTEKKETPTRTRRRRTK